MREPFRDSDLTGVAALAEPVRRRLYEVVVAAAEPTGREAAAEAAGVAVHTAKFHLDRLVEVGLLAVEYRRISGRSGPGAGRPAKLYRRGSAEVAVSLPPRHYDLLSRILVHAVAESAASERPVASLVDERARVEGVAIGRAGGSPGASELDRVAATLVGVGFEPSREGDEVRLRNCPFHRAAQEQTALVCGLNRTFVDGVCAGLGCTGVEAVLEPTPGHCCVVVRG